MKTLLLGEKESLHCYDNGGKTIDRYTVVFLDSVRWLRDKPEYDCVGMSHDVTSPQGFYQHSTCFDGPHLGKRIIFEQLPMEHRQRIVGELREAE